MPLATHPPQFLSKNTITPIRTLVAAALAGLALAALATRPAHAQQFFRIGTGGTAGTNYPVGGMIANAVSQPGKIVVTAQANNGSLAEAASEGVFGVREPPRR